jgi:hypothetical protein
MSSTIDHHETLAIPCPDCNELSPEPIERIVENDVIPCSLCAGLIDLNAENCRPLVEQARAILAGRSKGG